MPKEYRPKKNYLIVSKQSPLKVFKQNFRSFESAWNHYAQSVADPSNYSVKLFENNKLMDDYHDKYSRPEFLESQTIKG